MSVMPSKEPFEKIRSQIERNKLLEALVSGHSEVVCKSEGCLFIFIPMKFSQEAQISGSIEVIEGEPKSGQEIVGNFSAADDRYFFKGTIRNPSKEGVVEVSADVYKLQRRQTHRVMVPATMDMRFTIKSLDGSPVFVDGKFHDISAGGARVYFPPMQVEKLPLGLPEFKAEQRIEAIIRTTTGRTLDVEGTIKHILKLPDGQLHYGIQLDIQKDNVRNRLLSLVMDLQHKIVTGLSKK